MKRIGLLSDTHSYLDPEIFDFFEECDEIWHAGDIGNLDVTDKLSEFRPVRAVWGNIDSHEARLQFPEHNRFTIEGVKVWMTHIGGYPGRYSKSVRNLIRVHTPDLFISGHSHILKVMPDKKLGLIHMNPGAAGIHGFHKMKTLIRFSVGEGKVFDVQVIELGPRGKTAKKKEDK